MPEKNNLNCRIWVSNPKEKEAVLGLDPGIKMLGRSNRDVKNKNKNGVFFRPVYNSSFSPPYRGIYTILFGTRCYCRLIKGLGLIKGFTNESNRLIYTVNCLE